MNLFKEGHLSRRAKRSHSRSDAYQAYKTNGNLKENIINIDNYRQSPKKKVELLPKNLAQESYIEALENENIDIVIGHGYAGTGKTFLATLYAIKGLKEGLYDKVVISRPNVALDDRDIGYLPGGIYEKMAPWTRPILEIFEEYYSIREVQQMIELNTIEMIPLAFVRGRTLKRAVIILDEAQNTTKNSMLSFLTRIGEDSKMIITGDTKQTDRGKINGLSDLLERFTNNKHISICQFDRSAIERHPIIGDILKMYGEE